MINDYFFFFLILIINLIVFSKIDKFSNKLNLYDKPDYLRKIHKKKVSLLGGPILFLNILSYLIFKLIENYNYSDLILIFIITTIFILNLINDKKNISPTYRLICAYIIFFCWIIFDNQMLVSNLNFNFHNINIHLGNWGFIITPLFILIFLNALNLFDGVNLQSISYFIIFLFFLFLNGFDILNFYPLIIFLILFIFYNFKNKIFLGDSGVSILAVILSYLTITNYNNSDLLFCEEILFIMFIPGIDMLRLYFFRVYKKKNPFTADKNHLHHLYLEILDNKYIFLIQFFFYIFFLIGLYYLKLNINLTLIFMTVIYITLLIYAKFRKKL